jgi:hypothetical protein
VSALWGLHPSTAVLSPAGLRTELEALGMLTHGAGLARSAPVGGWGPERVVLRLDDAGRAAAWRNVRTGHEAGDRLPEPPLDQNPFWQGA